VKRYYDGHLKDYSGPAMMRIRGLAFTRRAAAESAVRKAREGTEWNWLAANAEGQAGNGAAGVLTFDGQPIMVSSMPDALQKAVAGSKAKDVRLYASPEGLFYALAILETIAPAPRPYAQVRDDVAKALYTETIGKNVEEYAAKLRVRTKVEIHLKKVQ
jgi:hypothetical protein